MLTHKWISHSQIGLLFFRFCILKTRTPLSTLELKKVMNLFKTTLGNKGYTLASLWKHSQIDCKNKIFQWINIDWFGTKQLFYRVSNLSRSAGSKKKSIIEFLSCKSFRGSYIPTSFVPINRKLSRLTFLFFISSTFNQIFLYIAWANQEWFLYLKKENI